MSHQNTMKGKYAAFYNTDTIHIIMIRTLSLIFCYVFRAIILGEFNRAVSQGPCPSLKTLSKPSSVSHSWKV
jgi:hypothetical protein